MTIENIRDVVLIVAGIVWALVFLAILIVTVVLFSFVHKYLGSAHGFMRDQVRPALERLQEQVQAARVRTAALPGHPAPLDAIQRPPRRAGFNFSLPFRRRRKPWYERIIGG